MNTGQKQIQIDKFIRELFNGTNNLKTADIIIKDKKIDFGAVQ